MKMKTKRSRKKLQTFLVIVCYITNYHFIFFSKSHILTMNKFNHVPSIKYYSISDVYLQSCCNIPDNYILQSIADELGNRDSTACRKIMIH